MKMKKIEEKAELEIYTQVIVTLVARYGFKWAKISRLLKKKENIELEDYQVERFYKNLPSEKIDEIMKNKDKTPDMTTLLVYILGDFLDEFDLLRDTEAKSDFIHSHAAAVASLGRAIIDVREKISKATDEKAWDTKLDKLLGDCTRLAGEIFKRYMSSENSITSMNEWKSGVKAIIGRSNL